MDMWTTSFLNKNNKDVYERSRITESRNLNQYKPSAIQLQYNYHIISEMPQDDLSEQFLLRSRHVSTEAKTTRSF